MQFEVKYQDGEEQIHNFFTELEEKTTMGILSGLCRTRDGPKNATSGSTYSFFMGTSAAGKDEMEELLGGGS